MGRVYFATVDKFLKLIVVMTQQLQSAMTQQIGAAVAGPQTCVLASAGNERYDRSTHDHIGTLSRRFLLHGAVRISKVGTHPRRAAGVALLRSV